MLFKDRVDAGKKLSSHLSRFKDDKNTLIFAIPRGGVVVGRTIADDLNLGFDIILAKKIAAPFNSEVAIAALDINGDIVLNHEYIQMFNIRPEYIEHQKIKTLKVLHEQIIRYRGSIEYDKLTEKIAIVVDDGIATGATIKACINFLSKLNPKEIYIATPVIAPSALSDLGNSCDGVYYIISEEPFYAVGQFYIDFSEVDDALLHGLIKN